LLYATIDDDPRVCAVKVQQTGRLEIACGEIHHGKLQIRFEKLQDAVGFGDDVLV
jgi:hypothetical protein